MNALAPGLYKATVRGVAETFVFVDSARRGRTADYVGDHREHRSEDITDARPLIVLDLRNPLGFAGLLRGFARGGNTSFNIVADQIEAQTRPARIEEPGPWAVVKATTTRTNVTRAWVRGWADRWFYGDMESTWDDLIDPVLVRPGIEATS